VRLLGLEEISSDDIHQPTYIILFFIII
jgi:hypothetical protein